VQRHGRDEIGVDKELGAGPRHPRTARPRHVSTIAMLERQDQTPAAIVVDQGGACPTETQPPGKTGGAQNVRTEILVEGRAAAGAVRWRDEGESRPAGRAKRARCADDFAAAQAERRQDAVEQTPAGGATDLERHDPDRAGKCAAIRAGPLFLACLSPYIHAVTSPDPLLVFDRTVLRIRRERAARGWDQRSFLKREIAERLVERLDDVRRTFPLALDLGCHGDEIAAALRGRQSVGELVRADLGFDFARRAAGPAIVADEEALPFAVERFDLVLSAMNLHWVNDLPGTLIQIARILRPDGLFLGAMLGGRTLWQLREALAAAESEIEGGLSPRVSPFADLGDAAGLLQRAGFALPVADSETIEVEYEHALALMRDLGAMGEGNLVDERRRGFSRRTTLLRAAEIYGERFALPSGRVTASFEVLYLHGWAPHASQPQPLKPGAARHRLATALGTTEISTGQKVERN
jgi:NADH dehydrogenase [ubiquinone] 1 alpha subcomplex assembly factor 5